MPTDRTIKVVFCWAEASGYMSACWRALDVRPGVNVHILHTEQMFARQTNRYKNQLDGLSNEMFDSLSPDVSAWLVEAVSRQRPDVVVVCGWIYWPYVRLLRSSALHGVSIVLGMDSPWRGTWSQRLARFRLAATLGRCELVVTAGERSATYARRLGVPEHKIRSGYYGYDFASFRRISAQRPADWPRQFLFVGRYVEQKDLPTLAAAYSRYRSLVDEPWGLSCCGEGPCREAIVNQPGITDRGFTAPSDLPSLFASHGAFVMASHFEPWGVAIGEAAASGLPILCTSACGASLDLVRPYYNGIVTAPRDREGLARAMQWIHNHTAELPVMGRRSAALAEGFSAEAWASRWHNYLLEVVSARSDS